MSERLVSPRPFGLSLAHGCILSHLNQKIEELLEIELSEDIGEWVADGVVLCKLVKKLHPQLMPSFHSPPLGKVS